MANYVKVNGLYVEDYTHIVGEDGRDYLVKLIFTREREKAKNVPNRLLARLLAALRKSLRLNNDDGDYLYDIRCIDGDVELCDGGSDSVDKPKTKRSLTPPKVIVDLDWLKSYMLTRGISTTQLAKDFGYTGDKIYYGTKILAGKVRINLLQMKAFVKIHPSASSHYYLPTKD